MRGNNSGISRRRLLQTIGSATALTGISGIGSADAGDKVYVNIGFDHEAGRSMAVTEAEETVREFSFGAVTARVPTKAVERLQQHSDVRYVEKNGRMHALAQTTPWGIDRVDADVAHDAGYTGSGADIAIIDTGIDASHPDLQANLGAGYAVTSCSWGCDYDWGDDNGHGTHCAGTANAVNNAEGVVGVSANATLHAVKVLNSYGSGSYSDIAAGIEYVADRGWDVASLSLGGSYSAAVADAVDYAYSRGVLVVAAAGNSGPCTDCVGHPASHSDAMAVSATNNADGLASFSSTGPEVEIAAPGADIYSTYTSDGYNTLSGTSMACPHVAGAGGLLMSEGYTNTEARQRLTSTAENIGLSSNEQGAGLLDAASALGL
ncbi:S8 family peptidase [Halocatena pleomorpha]|uniref:Peptidase S8 n=1 Tax=Halocatena pleomorpha TaxID=1785090 RepID=A0A3P3RJP5_9EURY|nr:S8 family peptidase [Halocatena pleomorpha]RRJ33544.1 peptidase S8 [Halocatena pleomorpha]